MVSLVALVVTVIGAARRSALTEQLRASLWFVPALAVVGASGLAGVLSTIELGDESWLGQAVYPGGAGSARGILQTIAGSVITVTGVVFSLTVVTLQLASSQFSPRLLRTFIRDVRNQVVLAVFLATFAYCLVALRAIRAASEEGPEFVPGAAITGAYVLTAASVIALVFFIDHIARSIRIDSLMRKVNEDTVAIIDRLAEQRHGAEHARARHRPTEAVAVESTRSGFVQAIDEHGLRDVALRRRCDVWIELPIGDRVIVGTPLAWITAAAGVDADVATEVNACVQVGFERTMQQDVSFGLRQLVDVAVKALSPGINDPTTAVHATGHLAHLLVRILQAELAQPNRMLSAVPLVVTRERTFAEHLDLACGQIRRYGASEPEVMRELLRLLRDVAYVDQRGEHSGAVREQADRITAAAERAIELTVDLRCVHEARLEVDNRLAHVSSRA